MVNYSNTKADLTSDFLAHYSNTVLLKTRAFSLFLPDPNKILKVKYSHIFLSVYYS
jgi:hypothetical protein